MSHNTTKLPYRPVSFSQLGLTASETVHLLYRRIKLQRGLPFDVRIPNALTTRTLHASKAGKNVKRFGSKKELFVDLRC